MKIKTLLYTTAAGLLTLASCDTVSENDRYIYVEEAEVQRCVLLEDFTGQQCPNCPNAAVETNKLQESYPNSVIAVAIHGGPLSPNTPVSLKSHVGDLYYSAAGQPNLRPDKSTGSAERAYPSSGWVTCTRPYSGKRPWH